MANPFRFGKPVEGEFYLERPELRDIVLNFLTNNVNVVLIGPRRFGKTSFILNLLAYLEARQEYTCVLVDIFNITSHRDFLQQLINGLRTKKSLFVRLSEWVKTLPSACSPMVTLDDNEGLSLRFSSRQIADADIKQLIIETLNSLGHIAPRLCIAFDEFQSIARIEDDGWLEATIRSKMQEHNRVCFLFSGSRREIIHDMFNNNARPFYRTCQLMDFPPPGPGI